MVGSCGSMRRENFFDCHANRLLWYQASGSRLHRWTNSSSSSCLHIIFVCTSWTGLRASPITHCSSAVMLQPIYGSIHIILIATTRYLPSPLTFMDWPLGNEADVLTTTRLHTTMNLALFTILHPSASTTIKTNTVPPLLLSSITPSTATKSHRYPFLQLTYNTKQHHFLH